MILKLLFLELGRWGAVQQLSYRGHNVNKPDEEIRGQQDLQGRALCRLMLQSGGVLPDAVFPGETRQRSHDCR